MKTIFLKYGMNWLQIKNKNRNKTTAATTAKNCINKLFTEICLNEVYASFVEELFSESA